MAAPESLRFRLVNNSGATAYAYITGQADADGRVMFVRADGSVYHPTAGGPVPELLGEDPAIPVNGSAEVMVPRMYGARVYFVTDDKLEFFTVQAADGGTALVHPTFGSSDADPNFDKNWTFAEFTLNSVQLYANISYVDFVAAPVGLHLVHAGGTQEVAGLPDGAIDRIASALRDQGGAWPTCVQEVNGTVFRALNPNHRAGDFAGYMDEYVDQVWQKYANEPLFIDSQRGDIGILEGRVEGDDLVTQLLAVTPQDLRGRHPVDRSAEIDEVSSAGATAGLCEAVGQRQQSGDLAREHRPTQDVDAGPDAPGDVRAGRSSLMNSQRDRDRTLRLTHRPVPGGVVEQPIAVAAGEATGVDDLRRRRGCLERHHHHAESSLGCIAQGIVGGGLVEIGERAAVRRCRRVEDDRLQADAGGWRLQHGRRAASRGDLGTN